MEIENSFIGVEFIINVKFKKPSKRVKFNRNLYGYRRYSNYGKYLYVEEGLLSNISHIKPTKSVMIVSEKNAKTIREFFKKWEVDFREIRVILSKEEAEKIK